jgi:hypothetical protein
MDKDDDGRNVVDMNCYCKSKHCNGNIYIQQDSIKGEKLFMITVLDTKGNESGSMWLLPEQLKQLAKEIEILVAEMQ